MRYDYSVNEESIEVARAILDDPKVGHDKSFIRWVLPYTNSENAEYMLRAILNKDYQAVYGIQDGYIRLFDTLDARYAVLGRIKNTKFKNQGFADIMQNRLMVFAEDDISIATKVLFEDSFYTNEFILKVAPKINKSNVEDFKKAFLNRDIEAIERLCGEKFSTKELGFIEKEKAGKSEFNTTSSTGKITRADFVKYINNKFAHTKKLDTSELKASEVRNLAKLFGVTEEQILNMDRKVYRGLCIKFHPDKNPNDSLANQVFSVLNRIFQG